MVKPKTQKKVKAPKKQAPKTKKKIVKREKKQAPKVAKKAPAKPKALKKQSKFYTTDLVKPTEEQIKIFEQSTSGLKKKDVQGKESYHLYEDLLIILEVVKLMKENKEEKQSFWKLLAEKNLLKRSQESMRDRFKRQLRYLTTKDYVTICQHLKEQGECKGYLEFQFVSSDNKVKGKFLNSVTLEDPRLIKNPSAEKAAK